MELSLYFIRYCIVFSQQGDKSELSGATLNFLPQQLIERAVRSLCRNSTCNVPRSFRRKHTIKSIFDLCIIFWTNLSNSPWVLVRCHRLIRFFKSLIGKSLFGITMMNGLPPPHRALPLTIPCSCEPENACNSRTDVSHLPSISYPTAHETFFQCCCLFCSFSRIHY